MKNLLIPLLISILTGTGCYAQKNNYEQADSSVLTNSDNSTILKNN